MARFHDVHFHPYFGWEDIPWGLPKPMTEPPTVEELDVNAAARSSRRLTELVNEELSGVRLQAGFGSLRIRLEAEAGSDMIARTNSERRFAHMAGLRVAVDFRLLGPDLRAELPAQAVELHLLAVDGVCGWNREEVRAATARARDRGGTRPSSARGNGHGIAASASACSVVSPTTASVDGASEWRAPTRTSTSSNPRTCSGGPGSTTCEGQPRLLDFWAAIGCSCPPAPASGTASTSCTSTQGRWTVPSRRNTCCSIQESRTKRLRIRESCTGSTEAAGSRHCCEVDAVGAPSRPSNGLQSGVSFS